MEGGTHAEALRAGFTREQAIFFTRATMEIKNECWQHFERELNKRSSYKKDLFIQNLNRIAPFGLAFILGATVGYLCILL